jgi:hypothetical protein
MIDAVGLRFVQLILGAAAFGDVVVGLEDRGGSPCPDKAWSANKRTGHG